jgi:hypothetical protein
MTSFFLKGRDPYVISPNAGTSGARATAVYYWFGALFDNLFPSVLELPQPAIASVPGRLPFHPTNLAIDLLEPTLREVSSTRKPLSAVPVNLCLQLLPPLVIALWRNPPSPLKLP